MHHMREASPVRTGLAWSVHAYTALGLVVAGGMAIAIVDATYTSFRLAFPLMLVATLIDATDGTLARWVRIKEVLPGFDGRRLDDLIDFQTFTTLPLLLIYQARVLPAGQEYWLIAPLLASAYGFCQVNAKTDDGYFLGFPSYWNIIAFYLYVLQPPTIIAIGMLLFFSAMTFVPARYLYPTHRGKLNRWTNHLAAVWTVMLVWIVVRLPEDAGPDDFTRLLAALSLWFPLCYLGVSWAISVRIVLRARRLRAVHRQHAGVEGVEPTRGADSGH